MLDREKFAKLRGEARTWAVAAIHGDAARLVALHDALAARIQPRDRVVYLGNYLGLGTAVAETVDELVTFRRWLLARPDTFRFDVAYLRGAQEEMWSKLLQLQFAPNPGEVLKWLLEHGAEATVRGYGGDPIQGFQAAREGPVTIGKWTTSLRDSVQRRPGHTPFFTGLRRAAYTADQSLLFVHAGIDPNRPLSAQSDSFWWAASSFAKIDAPYEGFGRVVRGFDPAHAGLTVTDYTTTVDGGSGFGGTLIAACLDTSGQVVDSIEV